MERLPPELVLGVVQQGKWYIETDDPDLTWHIATHHRFLAPTICPLARTNPWFQEVVRLWFYGTWKFTYLASATGWHGGATGQGCAGDDLEIWLTRDVGRRNRSLIRKLHLEMYGSELLALFAPDEAAKLLKLPVKRGCWTRVLALLRKMQLHDLTIAILPETCPSPCSAGGRNVPIGYYLPYGHRNFQHFDIDFRWIMRAVLTSMLPTVPLSAITFQYGVSRVIDRGCEVEDMINCSWSTIHSYTKYWHSCDLFSSGGRRYLVPAVIKWEDPTADVFEDEGVEDDVLAGLFGPLEV